MAMDAPHGLTSYLAQGDTVDVLTESNGTTTVLAQNVTVLGNQNGEVVLRLTDKQVLAVSAAADTQKIWLSLRPPVGAQQSVGIGAKGGA
jgi:outer membrane lipoprotein-sorting protein